MDVTAEAAAPLAAAPGSVELRSLSKSYGPAVAVDDVTLHVQAGEFLSLLGPSGCGKTTTLRMIGGFEFPDDGSIQISGRNVENLPPHNEDGAGGSHVYAPWWLYGQQLKGELGFARGYHIEMGTGRRQPSLGTGAGLEWLTQGSYGAKLKEDVRRYYGSFVYLSGRGEMIPNKQSYCELDPEVKDRYGLPVLRFHWQWSDHETRQAAHMQKTFVAIIEAMGGKVIGKPELDGRKAIAPGGFIIHEIGGTIMGTDPKTSVVNQWLQSWDVKNLFITDGAILPSNADKNPTLTIMALAWRAADEILRQLKRKEL